MRLWLLSHRFLFNYSVFEYIEFYRTNIWYGDDDAARACSKYGILVLFHSISYHKWKCRILNAVFLDWFFIFPFHYLCSAFSVQYTDWMIHSSQELVTQQNDWINKLFKVLQIMVNQFAHWQIHCLVIRTI